MVARTLLLVIPALALAACSPSGDGEAAARGVEEATTHFVPAKFRGRWGESVAACLSHNARRYEIAAGRIDSGQFGGKVEAVRLRGDTANVRLSLEHGEVQFSLSLIDNNTMQATYGEREPFTLTMCR